MIGGAINVGLSVWKEPSLSEAICCLEKHHMTIAMGVTAMSKAIGSIRDPKELEANEKELATESHICDCLSIAIHTLKGLA